MAVKGEMVSAADLLRRGLRDQAASVLNEILERFPHQFDASFLLGDIEFLRGNHEKARARYQDALRADPHCLPVRMNLANALSKLGLQEEALRAYEIVLSAEPDNALAWFNRANALTERADYDAARASLDKALSLDPGFEAARVARCMAEIQVIYRSQDEIAQRRKAYEEQLRRLRQRPNAFGGAIGVSQPFYLAYQGENDRDLQGLYGEAVCRQARLEHPEFPLAAPPPPGQRIRVGVVSGFFRNHANWRAPLKGWLSQLDRGKFQLFGYYVGSPEDDATAEAERLVEKFAKGDRSLDEWRAEILSDQPHVLIYPEIGMDATIPGLAAQRLAPVQCSSWGHPETSGFPTIDYFLSSDLMEPENGRDHYSEDLVRLPNLSVYLEPVERSAAPLRRGDVGLVDGVAALWCGQSLYKFLPRYDDAFARIAESVGRCQFVFVSHRSPHVTGVFQRRLATAFAERGLNHADYCRFLPRMPQDRFIAATGLCDAYLDSVGWSGCNTALEALAYDLPIVTLPLQLMRSRHCAAFLTMMGVTELIATSLDEFISIAARLAKDQAYRSAMRERIGSNKTTLFEDKAPVTALERFLESRVRAISSGTV